MHRSQVNKHGSAPQCACYKEWLVTLACRGPLPLACRRPLALSSGLALSTAALLRSCALVFLAAAFAPLHADVGRTGAVFMREGFDPRAKALGEAYVGVADDAYAMFYNVSGLSQINRRLITTAYFKGLADSDTQFVGYVEPLGAYQSVGIGLVRFTAGTIDIYRPSTQVESRNAEQDWLLSLGYGIAGRSAWRGQWHLGAGLKMFKSTLAEEVRGHAEALDLGGLWTNPRFSLGISLSNLGPGIRYKGGIATGYRDSLPTTLRFGGAALIPLAPSSNRWLLTGEIRKVFLERTTLAMGTEFLYRNIVALRLGYRTGQDLGSLSLGMGFQWEGFRLDYSLGTMQAINHQQAISITHFFGPGRRRAGEAPRAETAPVAEVSASTGAPEIAAEVVISTQASAATLTAEVKPSTTTLTIGAAEVELSTSIPAVGLARPPVPAPAQGESAIEPVTDPASIESLYDQALKAYAQRNLDEAVRLLKEVIAKNPDHERAQKALDRILKEQGK